MIFIFIINYILITLIRYLINKNSIFDLFNNIILNFVFQTNLFFYNLLVINYIPKFHKDLYHIAIDSGGDSNNFSFQNSLKYIFLICFYKIIQFHLSLLQIFIHTKCNDLTLF
jgi:hypothetical protein